MDDSANLTINFNQNPYEAVIDAFSGRINFSLNNSRSLKLVLDEAEYKNTRME
ncbi:hypothetical protein JW711_04480 [Candidatus Woesearchaeota archaeon]|nr:hypothetical protein [Candidatus Woesearchaeota archaeon]